MMIVMTILNLLRKCESLASCGYPYFESTFHDKYCLPEIVFSLDHQPQSYQECVPLALSGVAGRGFEIYICCYQHPTCAH